MLYFEAPAKINLTLEVLGKSPDGYHEIRSLIQTISLTDSITVKPAYELSFKCSDPNWDSEKSLVRAAAVKLCEISPTSAGAEITILKRVPLLSGLGGDSSDAAVTLRALSNLWGLDLNALPELAKSLGSDVPFLLSGGTALISGRGEVVKPLCPLRPMWFVLLLPPLKPGLGKTRRLYGALSEKHFSSGELTEELAMSIDQGGNLGPGDFCNVFDSVAGDAFPGLSEYWQRFLGAGARHVHLAGSGPTLYAAFSSLDEARLVKEKLVGEGLEAHIATPWRADGG